MPFVNPGDTNTEILTRHGESSTYSLLFVDENGGTQDLTGFLVDFYVHRVGGGEPVLHLSNAPGGTRIDNADAVTGDFLVCLEAVDMEHVRPGKYCWSTRITDRCGVVLEGELSVDADGVASVTVGSLEGVGEVIIDPQALIENNGHPFRAEAELNVAEKDFSVNDCCSEESPAVVEGYTGNLLVDAVLVEEADIPFTAHRILSVFPPSMSGSFTVSERPCPDGKVGAYYENVFSP